jgi:hypothetical protein
MGAPRPKPEPAAVETAPKKIIAVLPRGNARIDWKADQIDHGHLVEALSLLDLSSVDSDIEFRLAAILVASGARSVDITPDALVAVRDRIRHVSYTAEFLRLPQNVAAAAAAIPAAIETAWATEIAAAIGAASADH